MPGEVQRLRLRRGSGEGRVSIFNAHGNLHEHQRNRGNHQHVLAAYELEARGEDIDSTGHNEQYVGRDQLATAGSGGVLHHDRALLHAARAASGGGESCQEERSDERRTSMRNEVTTYDV